MSLVDPVILTGAALVEAVLRHGRAKPEELIVPRGGSTRGLARLVSTAESKGVPVRWTEEAEGGVSLRLGLREADPLGTPSLVLAIEGIEDPHNLGDVLRTAFAAGADAAVLDAHARAMPRDLVARSSAGASECLPLVFADTIAHALAELRALGVEPMAATAEGGEDAFRAKWPARVALVVGGERRGLSRATLDACPRRLTLPMRNEADSLSAAAGAAVLLFEWARRHQAMTQKR